MARVVMAHLVMAHVVNAYIGPAWPISASPTSPGACLSGMCIYSAAGTLFDRRLDEVYNCIYRPYLYIAYQRHVPRAKGCLRSHKRVHTCLSGMGVRAGDHRCTPAEVEPADWKDPEVIKMIVDSREAGLSNREIADALGLTWQRIAKVYKDAMNPETVKA